MTDLFDPYYNWLAIPPREQPPDHYRLLGLPRYEENPNVISNAMDQRSAYLRTLQTGKHAADSQRLLNEVAAAAGCLLNVERKAAYDRQLRDEEAQRPQPARAAPEFDLATRPALKPQYPASLLPQPGEVVASPALPAQPATPARPNTALIAAAIGVPLVLAAIVIAALALGSGDPGGGQVEVISPEKANQAPPTTVSTTVTPPANNAPPAASHNTSVSAPAVIAPLVPPSPGGVSATGPLPKFQPGRGLDLLPWAAKDLRLIRGDAKYDGQVLSVASQSTAFTLPADFPDEYVLEADVTRESGTNSLCFGFPVHGRPLTAVIDGFFSKQSGLASIDSREIYTERNPQVKNGRVLTNGQQATVRIEVTAGAVRLAVDGQTLVTWNWDPAAKVRSAQGMTAGDLTRLHVFTWDAAYRFTRLELLPAP